MENILEKRKYLGATLDRIEGDKAVFVLDQGQIFDWPVANLPSGMNEGARVKLIMMTDKDEEREREELAKAVLNEMLKVD